MLNSLIIFGRVPEFRDSIHKNINESPRKQFYFIAQKENAKNKIITGKI